MGMDWFLMAAEETSTAPDPALTARGDSTGRLGPPHHMAQGADPARLDLAVAHSVERLAETVLAGVQVAALYGAEDQLSVGAVLPGGSPSWLAADLDLLVQLVRLSTAAGVVLPHGVSGTPSSELTRPTAHLASCRDCYREVIDVLSRMSVAEEVPATCRDDALRLLRLVERRVRHLGDGHPGLSSLPVQSAYNHEFIPGELLG